MRGKGKQQRKYNETFRATTFIGTLKIEPRSIIIMRDTYIIIIKWLNDWWTDVTTSDRWACAVSSRYSSYIPIARMNENQ